jgi:hypothetical protein
MFIYAETIAILAAVAFVLHELVSVDLPWAVAIGAAAAVVVRTLLHRRTAVRPTQQ